MIGTAASKPKRGTAKRQKAAGKRVQAKADKLVYAAVDARDGHRCRVCLEYRGVDIQRHHILPRSRSGPTTTANVVSLCAECHLVGVHGKRLVISGSADERLQIKAAVAFRNGQATSWAIWDGAA
jgi:5-methylcytosine-specific restriction endonuclease McrA